MAEVILNHVGRGKFKAFSAGSHPAGPNPIALATLRQLGFPADELRSKSWDEFAQPGAPVMDFIFTLCDNAAREVCPVWPGRPITAHWGIEDPGSFAGTAEEKAREFERVATILRRRIEQFTSLPLADLDHASLEKKLKEIGKQ